MNKSGKKSLYIIKKINPWMIDELQAFARVTSFDVLLLRKYPEFYENEISQLKDKGINFWIINKSKLDIKRLFFCIIFFWTNLNNCRGWYNFAIGIQSIYYFLKTDKNIIDNIDSMHAQFATQASIVGCLIKEYLQNNADLFITCHAYDIFYKNNWLNYIIGKANNIFCISEYNRNYIINNYKVNYNNILVSRLGVNCHNNYKACYKGHTINIGFLSFFEEKKGIVYLLDSLLLLKNSYNIIFKMHIAGDGNKSYKALIDVFIKKNNLKSDVIIYGKVKGESKDRFYKAIDIFVLPSVATKNDMDGIPVVLMEAISYGIPIISTNISGIPEICYNRFNGLLIPQKDPNAISSAINEIYNKLSLWESYSRNSKKVFEDKYSIDKNSKQKLKLMGWV